jgi:hypothetical protein
MDTNMNLNKELLARIEDMSQAEQELLLASLTAKESNENVLSLLNVGLKVDGDMNVVKDDLIFLALSALENDVPPMTVFQGTYSLFQAMRS